MTTGSFGRPAPFLEDPDPPGAALARPCGQGGEVGWYSISAAEPRLDSVSAAAIEFANVTEQVALRVGHLEGSGAQERAYEVATEACREHLARVAISGEVAVIREERPDERGQLRVRRAYSGSLRAGQGLGGGGMDVDLAVEPVEGLQLLAKGQEGSITAIAAAPRGTMLRTPDMYMRKLIVGPRSKGHIDIEAPVAENVEAIARAVGRKTSEISIAVLDRERHEDLIEEIRATGARIHIRPEGDLTPVIAVGLRGSDLHGLIGIGGTPEGILAAVAIKCLGGEMQAKMWPTKRSQVRMLRELGLDDPERKLTLDDLIRGDDLAFAATGITAGETLQGVRYFRGGGRTHTVVMSSRPRMVRFVDTIHALEPEAGLQGFQL